MADSFNKDAAYERHKEIVEEIQRIRDGVSKDVIDYYYKAPESEEDEKVQREGMRKFLKIAQERIDDLLNRKLYQN